MRKSYFFSEFFRTSGGLLIALRNPLLMTGWLGPHALPVITSADTGVVTHTRGREDLASQVENTVT